MKSELRFALNHMVAPRLSPESFFALAQALGIGAVEIRNDLAGNAILDGTPPSRLRRLAEEAGVRILSINALQRFDDWRAPRPTEAVVLADYARACGAEAVVLVPCNDGSRPDRLLPALESLKPILGSRRLTGLVEPLGFESCSLRLKSEAVAAIAAVGGRACSSSSTTVFTTASPGNRRSIRQRPGWCTSPASTIRTSGSPTCATDIGGSSPRATGWATSSSCASSSRADTTGSSRSSRSPRRCRRSRVPQRRSARAWPCSDSRQTRRPHETA